MGSRSSTTQVKDSSIDAAQLIQSQNLQEGRSPGIQTHPPTNLAQTKQIDSMVRNNLSSGIQAKLNIGQPNDQYEQEADSVAEQVMSMPETAAPQVIQRDILSESEGEDVQMKPLVQRRMAGGAQMQNQAHGGLEETLQSSKSGGAPLSDNVRSFMEPRFGADFSGVRVHTGAEAVQMNQDLNARAFAHGNHLYFSDGQTPGNDALTAHELTHVVQQGGAGSIQAKPVQMSQNNVTSIQRSPVQVSARAPGPLLSKSGLLAGENIPGGAKNIENMSGSTEAVVTKLEAVARQAGGKFGEDADFRTNVAPKIDAAFASNLSQTNIPIDFVEQRGINMRWKGYVRFTKGPSIVVNKGSKTSTNSNYGGSATQSDKITDSQTDSGKVTGARGSVGGELSTSDTRSSEGGTSTTTNRGGSTTTNGTLVTYEAPIIAEVYLAPELDVSGTDYVNPFKWGMYLGQAVAPLRRVSGKVKCGKFRYSLSK
jgi:hypothetical protein